MYVALSRSTSLQGLHILGQIDSKNVRADSRVHDEYERLRNNSSVSMQQRSEPIQNIQQNSSNLTLSLLNIRSLRKHSIDIKFDSNIFSSDIIALTETQLLPQDTDHNIRNDLNPFSLYRQDHISDKYSSLALCTKNNIEITQQEYFPSINALKFVATKSSIQQQLSFLLLYRRNSSNVSQFINSIEYLLRSDHIDIILGDFNINYFNEKDMRPLESLMHSLNYVQIVQIPTFISSGTLLDHIYMKPTAFDIIHNTVISVYYSDHDAVKVSLHL